MELVFNPTLARLRQADLAADMARLRRADCARQDSPSPTRWSTLGQRLRGRRPGLVDPQPRSALVACPACLGPAPTGRSRPIA